MSFKLTPQEAVDHLESFIEHGKYNASKTTKDAVRITLDELTRVQAALNEAAGEIVVLREQVNQHMTSLNELGKFSTSMIQDLQKKHTAGLTLTIDQIKDLAGFAGLRVEGEIDDEDKETEITITTCPKQGVKDDGGSIVHYRHIAYLEEYPEEGVGPLGQQTK